MHVLGRARWRLEVWRGCRQHRVGREAKSLLARGGDERGDQRLAEKRDGTMQRVLAESEATSVG